ncbi:MAG: glycosyltransferase, partial [Mycobacterium sp.]
MSDPVSARPAICLNMIVRNEAHVIREALDSVAPYISWWVIVDTGSDDGTQDVIRNHMAGLGIPGELYEQPWRNFGYNRTEALALARGHGDYIWVIDADDTVVGTPDFTQLSADLYMLRYRGRIAMYWRPQFFRDGLRWRYEGVVHEGPVCDDPYVEAHLEGEYHIEYRQLGDRSRDTQKWARDTELLLPEVERNPEDIRSMFYLAMSYMNARDYVNAHKWFARYVEIENSGENAYLAMYWSAESMVQLGEPWPDVQDAYLRAWEFRPTRAEPLYAIARRYRIDGHYRLGYLFAERAAEIPFPEEVGSVSEDVYGWRATDEQAICASRIGKHPKAFALCRGLLARPDIPDDARQRIAGNRDFSVPTMLDAASSYPEVLVGD